MSIKYKSREINAIVLDFDGTFYSNKELELKIWSEARKKLVDKLISSSNRPEIRATRHEELLTKFVDLAIETGWENSFVEFGGTAADFHEIADNVTKAEYLKFDQKLTDFLQVLSLHVSVYIFTGSNRKTVIDALGVLTKELWIPPANNLLAVDDMKVSNKPNIAAYEEMLNVFGLEAHKTIFVDDQEVEVNSAANLNIITFLINENKDSDVNFELHTPINSLVELQNHLIFE